VQMSLSSVKSPSVGISNHDSIHSEDPHDTLLADKTILILLFFLF